MNHGCQIAQLVAEKGDLNRDVILHPTHYLVLNSIMEKEEEKSSNLRTLEKKI